MPFNRKSLLSKINEAELEKELVRKLDWTRTISLPLLIQRYSGATGTTTTTSYYNIWTNAVQFKVPGIITLRGTTDIALGIAYSRTLAGLVTDDHLVCYITTDYRSRISVLKTGMYACWIPHSGTSGVNSPNIVFIPSATVPYSTEYSDMVDYTSNRVYHPEAGYMLLDTTPADYFV